jgi:hypothetical protein
MSLWSKIRGTIETIFQLGLGGPQLKNNAGVIEARNPTDAAYVVVRGLDPVAANDFATKNYVDNGSGGQLNEVRYALGTGAAQSSVTVLPAGSYVRRAALSITTPYSGGANISLGQAGSVSLLAATTDVNPQAVGMYELSLDVPWGAAPLAILATITGAPAAGVGVVIVEWCTPAN